MVAQHFDDVRVALPEPFYYLPVPELCLFVICELLVLLARFCFCKNNEKASSSSLGYESTFSDLGPD
jgi:hypothetical protein